MTGEIISDSGWERQRQTGRFVVEAYSLAETNAWLDAVGLPVMAGGETMLQWRDRTSSTTTPEAESIDKEGAQ